MLRRRHLSLRVADASSSISLQTVRTRQPQLPSPSGKAGLVSAFSAMQGNETAASALEEARLRAAMRASAAGPSGNDVFLVMVNQAAAEHHLPIFLKSLRLVQVRS